MFKNVARSLVTVVGVQHIKSALFEGLGICQMDRFIIIHNKNLQDLLSSFDSNCLLFI